MSNIRTVLKVRLIMGKAATKLKLLFKLTALWFKRYNKTLDFVNL